ncbi:hypothetical protein EDC96DRAFT_569226 [Choanephora cucurbitarum]|nr:hypothetical protein EDC96DRAFT_569226 [Choanephora cucurbitarum]
MIQQSIRMPFYTALQSIHWIPPASMNNPISNIQYPISNIQYPISNIQYPISNIQYPITSILTFSTRSKDVQTLTALPAVAGKRSRLYGSFNGHSSQRQEVVRYDMLNTTAISFDQTEYWTLDTGHWTLDTGHWTLDTGHWTLDTGHWTLDTGHWTLDTGHWTLDTGPWTLDTGN